MKSKIKRIEDNNWDYFDGCLICQVMKKADEEVKSLEREELELVFAKQNLKNKNGNLYLR